MYGPRVSGPWCCLPLGVLASLLAGCSVVNAPDSATTLGGGAGGTATTEGGAGGVGGSTTTTSGGGGSGGGGGGGACGPLDTLQNCGACGQPCAPQHASGATCASGSCAYSACEGSYQDCDSIAANGCESDGQTDVDHCGGCAEPCSAVGYQNVTGYSCAAGACSYDACSPLFRDCDGIPVNGCETPTNTLSDCGQCDLPCAPANVSGPSCASGDCGYAACSGTYQSCDGNSANGCESDWLTDSGHCGSCSISCGVGETCVQGACLVCHAIGYASCPSGQTQFCVAGPLDPASAAQAEVACEACHGVPCYLETADCAGAAFGPAPLGQYVCGTAYFGYASGCTGDNGRVWAICSSSTTYGYWGK
jgi:hypothetical protein